MAEAPGFPLTQMLKGVFDRFADDLAGSIQSELGQKFHGGESFVSGSAAELGTAARVHMSVNLEGGAVWIARLEATEQDSETTLIVAHTLLQDGNIITGWQTSASVKTETGEQRPELLEAAAAMMPELASEGAVAQSAEIFDLRQDSVSQPDTRQHPAPGSTERHQPPPEPPEAIGLSASVRSVGNTVADRGLITAIDIAEALRAIHPEYAGGQFGLHALGLTPNTPVISRSWHGWLEHVRGLFDPEAVARTEEVIDGRLLLAALGVLDPPLLEQLDKSGVWGQLLVELDQEAIAGILPLIEAKAGVSLAHGYRNDDPEGRDRLNIEGEVNALCEVVTDPDVKPPLAIGLFGEWGSGKSFFMEKMRQRIHELDRAPRAADAPRGDVVQIRFNAWHYSDSNLWASLAVEIFDRLADPEPVDPEQFDTWLKGQGDDRSEQRRELLAQLESFREAQADLEDEKSRLDQRRNTVAEELETAQEARKTAIENASLGDVVAALAANSTVGNARAEIEQALDLSPAVTEWKDLGRELRTTSGYAANVW